MIPSLSPSCGLQLRRCPHKLQIIDLQLQLEASEEVVASLQLRLKASQNTVTFLIKEQFTSEQQSKAQLNASAQDGDPGTQGEGTDNLPATAVTKGACPECSLREEEFQQERIAMNRQLRTADRDRRRALLDAVGADRGIEGGQGACSRSGQGCVSAQA